MAYNGNTEFSGPLGQAGPSLGSTRVSRPFSAPSHTPLPKGDSGAHLQEPSSFRGEALARDRWHERYANGIVLCFTGAFALFLLGMNAAGQAPGQSFSLKSISDVLQFVGEGIGLFFCTRIALRLRGVSAQLARTLRQREMGHHSRNELAPLRTEVQVAQRTTLAWMLLAIAIALYASGQAIWTSYDVRMPSSQVPFPGLYDIGFVGSYPFFLAGTLLLTRRNRAAVGRTRLILDALAVLGAALALSWFFILSPTIAGLAQAPSPGAAVLSVYFPFGDLFLVAVGAFLMFSPLANREQQPVFFRLCAGLFCLAITDGLLGYFSLSPSGFNTGTLQDILWPLSMMLLGLAALEYPRSIAREQEQSARSSSAAPAVSGLLFAGRAAQVGVTLQTIAPFLLALFTCALLLTVIAPRGGVVYIQAGVIALALFLVVAARQALTMLENNRLTSHMRGELVVSKRELLVTRREADEASREAQEKRALEEGVAVLQQVFARIARGDFSARAPLSSGPLLPVAQSLNLTLDRLGTLAQRAASYERLTYEIQLLQGAYGRLTQGLPLWPTGQSVPPISVEFRPVFHSLASLQRAHESQWRRMSSTVTSMLSLTQRTREALAEAERSGMLHALGPAAVERMALDRAGRSVEQLEQQQRNLLSRIPSAAARFEEPLPSTPRFPHGEQHQQTVSPQQNQVQAWQHRRRPAE